MGTGHERPAGPSGNSGIPLLGALSFGATSPASAHFGQLLINLDYDLAKATLSAVEAQRMGAPEICVEAVEQTAMSRREALSAIQEALSSALNRTVRFEFPFSEHTPRIVIDGESIALDLVGEGMEAPVRVIVEQQARCSDKSAIERSKAPGGVVTMSM